MKNIKLRAVAAFVSSIAIISSVGAVSASAVETTSHNTEISETVTDPTYSTKLDAYNQAKAYLEEINVSSEAIASVLKHPDDTNHKKISSVQAFLAYMYAKDFLLNRGYDITIIDSVLINPI